MGCGASKGKEGEEKKVKEISFKNVSVYELDEFFRKCKEAND